MTKLPPIANSYHGPMPRLPTLSRRFALKFDPKRPDMRPNTNEKFTGDQLFENYGQVLRAGSQKGSAAPVSQMLINSFIMAVAIALGKIVISILSAFAIVYFRFPGRNFFFWMIFVTLMLPIEVRIIPTFKVAADLGLLDSYMGLTLPLIVSATATFLFRQFFLTIPDELAEAARMDGAGPMRFFRDVVLPLSKTNMAALFVILFIFGWTAVGSSGAMCARL